MTRSSNHDVSTLVRLCQTYGKDPLLIQAAGGNVSVKSSSRRMVIKASGFRMRQVKPHQGWAIADAQELRAALSRLSAKTKSGSELAYASLLTRASKTPGRRVSMEAGFHAILPDLWVIHLHSVAGMLLGMLPDARARRLVEKACGRRLKVHFVPWSLPGFELTRRMAKHVPTGLEPDAVHLWVQRYHGLAWVGSQSHSLRSSVTRFERSLRSHFRLARYPFPHRAGGPRCRMKGEFKPEGVSMNVCLCAWPAWRMQFNPLFPDFAIYFDLWGSRPPDLRSIKGPVFRIQASNPVRLRDKVEVFYAHALISTLGPAFGMRRTLSADTARALKNLETERLRLAQARSA